MPIETLERP